MGKVIETVKVANSAARTTLFAVVVGGLGYGGYKAYDQYTEREQLIKEQEAALVTMQQNVDQLNQDIAAKNLRIDKLETALHLLKVDSRLARLKVLDIQRDESGKAITSKLQFIELSPTGDSISAPKEFELPGDLIYVDNWLVQFDDKFVEEADLERGTSLCLFRRIFSEQQLPTDGFSLDEVGMRPQAYAKGGAMSQFEKQLWTNFWEFANDPDKAAEQGIRAANGEAVSIKVREGREYNISLRASGGLSIEPIKVPITEPTDSESNPPKPVEPERRLSL